MKRAALITMMTAFLGFTLAACTGGASPFEDRSGEVWIKHRVPSK